MTSPGGSRITPPGVYSPFDRMSCQPFLVGALCILYRVDLLACFDLVSPWPFAGWIITGLLIGRGSNFIHDFATRWLTRPPYE